MFVSPVQASFMKRHNKHGTEDKFVDYVQSDVTTREGVQEIYEDFYEDMPRLEPPEEWAHELFGMPDLEKSLPAIVGTASLSLTKDLLLMLSLCCKYEVPNSVCKDLCATLFCVYVAMTSI
ncbi:hypothetical protein KC19_7G177300 [Ceratodon purpureus]|uniref:Uncharacterized protein n=1 Tax=Ceratodon purpureus TaxID=3225 RepID=A0A8T0H7R9_CERPU|nr:hypothetical protein KC19_7G177300 [Ceratodon purpureus]